MTRTTLVGNLARNGPKYPRKSTRISTIHNRIQTRCCSGESAGPSAADIKSARAYCINLIRYHRTETRPPTLKLTNSKTTRCLLLHPPSLHPRSSTRRLPRPPRLQHRCRPHRRPNLQPGCRHHAHAVLARCGHARASKRASERARRHTPRRSGRLTAGPHGGPEQALQVLAAPHHRHAQRQSLEPALPQPRRPRVVR